MAPAAIFLPHYLGWWLIYSANLLVRKHFPLLESAFVLTMGDAFLIFLENSTYIWYTNFSFYERIQIWENLLLLVILVSTYQKN